MNARAQETPLSADVAINDHSVHIRPIQTEDLQRERAFVERLSPASRHFRFLGGVKQLSEKMLSSLCEINFDSRMAFIATVMKDGEEIEIGASRYSQDTDGDYECAVTVADEWQHHGLGKVLMTQLAEFARSKGIKSIYSLDLASNSYMRMLARDLGMSVKRDPQDTTLVRYELDL